MARGPKKHLKRINTPKSWLLSKMGGIYATRPNQGPHKLRECLPLSVVLRHQLKVALTAREAKVILKDQDENSGIKIDNKIRRDPKFPIGVGDVISIPKVSENYRLLYDIKGRFTVVRIDDKEASFKLLKVKTKAVGPNKVPYIVTNDARTIRYPNPEINEGDTIKYDLRKGQIVSWIAHSPGKLAYVQGGNNVGRVGTIMHFEKHAGSFGIVHLKDQNGKTFATRESNIIMIGQKKSLIALPRFEGKYQTILEERTRRQESKRKLSK